MKPLMRGVKCFGQKSKARWFWELQNTLVDPGYVRDFSPYLVIFRDYFINQYKDPVIFTNQYDMLDVFFCDPIAGSDFYQVDVNI